jgi:RsbRD-like negative regulator of sigma factor
MKIKEKSELGSVAAILERELEPIIKEWLRRVNLVSELTDTPLSDTDRTRHLPKLYSELISRLRLPQNADLSISAAATAHGLRRQEQGYSPAMLVAESRIFQVVTFGTLHLHLSELDQRRLLLDVMVIADEADSQLMGAVRSMTKGMPTPQ